ncbi:hypothetical protein IP91_00298 [Pseudoduganella lurida]|uniref:Uncharacterized protein n=1 Tax=Pseudoduganella lurida TaxID=1036180 RepID=A0A562RJH4_9BURK|nr:hypothetical protein [Pseudoduganella lurida]TWI69232.1 hypothetical protein IP91_00298 [Pseudoduganella lurida]
MTDPFENALAWFRAAPSRWYNSAKKDVSAAAEWIWEVLQGDFNDNQSTAQVATGTVISMIPFVDQICDVRDVVANCRKIHGEPKETWHWVALVLTLIGLSPTLGSLFKGCGKVVFASLRKATHTASNVPQIAKALDAGIIQLNRFLARPEVVKTLRALKIDNPYKYLANKFRALAAQINVAKLLQAFDEARKAAASLLGLVKRWGGAALAERAGRLLQIIDGVRRQADAQLAKAIKPVQDYLNKLARRLDIEAAAAHQARLNVRNPHAFIRTSADAEKAAFDHALPPYADKRPTLANDPLIDPPDEKAGWTSTEPSAARGRHPLDNAFNTFSTIDPITIPPGTTLYRVLDPLSSDNSICWMTKQEFDLLKSKDDWRRRFAVWTHWNSNGEYVTYVVPPGPGLNVWEGVTASQRLKGTDYVLEGGARQIVIDPAHLDRKHMGPRRPTNWGYDDLDRHTSMIGVPTLTNNWYEKK